MKDLHIRLPDDLADWIAQTAEAEHRTLNGQVNAMLQQASSAAQGGESNAGVFPVGLRAHQVQHEAHLKPS